MDIVSETIHLKPRTFSLLFKLGMVWRITYGVLRILFGLVLLRFIGVTFADLLFDLFKHEVSRDPRSGIFHFLHTILQTHSFTVTYFIASYMFFWGAVDIILSLSLLYRKMWAFPVSMILIILFIVYAIFRFTQTHSLVLLSVIIFDFIILALIYREYEVAKAHEVLPVNEESST